MPLDTREIRKAALDHAMTLCNDGKLAAGAVVEKAIEFEAFILRGTPLVGISQATLQASDGRGLIRAIRAAQRAMGRTPTV